MAAAKPTFRSAIADIRRQRFAPAYILIGEEPYYIDALADALQDQVVDEDAKDFDQHVYYGADVELETLMTTARQYPLMSDLKLVMLREAQSITGGARQYEKLERLFSNLPSQTIFLFAWKGDKGPTERSKWVKEAVAHGAVVLLSPKVKEAALPKLLAEYCSEKGISIDPKAAAMMSEAVGADVKRLFTEVDKLISGASQGEKPAITPELVEKAVGVSKEYNNFELVKAINSKDWNRSMTIARYFVKNSKQNPLVVTASMLFNNFSRIIVAHYLPDKTPQNIMREMGFRYDSQVKELGMAMRQYNAASCLRIIGALRDFDRKSKGVGSLQKDSDLFIDLIFNIFTL